MSSTESNQLCLLPAVSRTKAGLIKPIKVLDWLIHYLHLTFPHPLRCKTAHCIEPLSSSKWAWKKFCKNQLGLKMLISSRLASWKAPQMSPRYVPYLSYYMFFLMYEIPQTSVTYNNGVVKITDSYISIKTVQNAAPPCFWTWASY